MAEKTLEIVAGVVAWYLTSFGTLLLNKYLLGTLYIQPNTLAVVQMVSTAIYGALKTIKFSLVAHSIRKAWRRQAIALDVHGRSEAVELELAEMEDSKERLSSSATLNKVFFEMGLVGAMRFATVVLGLVSLKHIAASFTETVKSSAPFFTVVIAFLMLGERTSWEVMMSLVPVAGGLVMVSFSELSFNMIGFTAALATNVIECVQNVFSKRLLARDYAPSQLQFYTSLTALVLQAPIFLLSQGDSPSIVPQRVSASAPSFGLLAKSGEPLEGRWHLRGHGSTDQSVGGNATVVAVADASTGTPALVWDQNTILLLWIDGVLYHLQSVVAYVVMSHLSPVTVSVINTLKRALLIWISVLIFGNEVTLMSGLGTAMCLGGALLYNTVRLKPSTAPSK